jgi:hypothetical protein
MSWPSWNGAKNGRAKKRGKFPEPEISSNIHGHFRDLEYPRMEVRYQFSDHIFWGYSCPYIGHICIYMVGYGRYLQVWFLKWPLNICISLIIITLLKTNGIPWERNEYPRIATGHLKIQTRTPIQTLYIPPGRTFAQSFAQALAT